VDRAHASYLGVGAPLLVELDRLANLELGVLLVVRAEAGQLLAVPLVRQRAVLGQAATSGVQDRNLVQLPRLVLVAPQGIQFRAEEGVVVGDVRVLYKRRKSRKM
jgi:hypothetical protein